MVHNFALLFILIIRAASRAATGGGKTWHMFHQRPAVMADGACGRASRTAV